MFLALRLNPDGMQLWEIKGILEAELLWEPVDLQLEIGMAEAADLMSDVLPQSIGGEFLLMGLVNSQVIGTAEMVDITALVFVHGKRPDEKAVALSKQKGIPYHFSSPVANLNHPT